MFWGVVLENGKRYAQKVESSYHLTMATLDISSKKKGVVSLVLEQNKTEFILCNLDYEKQAHQQLDLVFDAEEEVSFFLKGDGVVHLTGYVLPDEYDGFDEEEDDDSIDEDESIQDEKSLEELNNIRNLKRKALIKGIENSENKKAKVEVKADEKKTVATTPVIAEDKKQKKATPLPTKKVQEVDSDEEEEDSDESDLDDEMIEKLMKDKKLIEDDDDEDDDEDDDDEDDDSDMDSEQLKKYKEEIKKQLSQPKGIIKKADDKKKPQAGTPAKQQAATPNKQQQQKKPAQQQSAQKQNGQANGKSPNANKNKKKFPNGLEFEDVIVGSGPVANKGRFLHVQYVGRLINNKEFDRSVGKPFAFRLGAGEVIKGWEIGMEGMKVGGKRLITVPPKLGYGNRKVGSIPANSVLKFEVELKAIQ